MRMYLFLFTEFDGVNENGFTMEECHEAYNVLIENLKNKGKVC